ncbi:hypothetical protein A5709_25655 [Mycobacterium sp. E1386]|nr:hypothetical protein A5709_25655 [Mycobacterium sp. E1386]
MGRVASDGDGLTTFRTRSPEHAIHLCESAFHPHKLRLLGPSKDFGFTQRLVQAGSITLADLTYDTDVSLGFAEGRDSYYVHVPIQGWLESQQLGQELVSSPTTASIYRPNADMAVTRWPGGSRHLGVNIDRLVVDTALETLLGRRPEAAVAFDPTLPLTDGPTRSWVSQLFWINRELGRVDNPLRHWAVLDRLAESLVYGLLLVANHPHREELASAVRPARPAAVREAMDIIERAPQSPLSTAALARQCNVSVRALQEGFQRSLGMSPMGYVRAVRLRRAHADLRAAHSSQTTVAAIAQRWGLGHLGRFAAAYQATFGETPVQTLRASAD